MKTDQPFRSELAPVRRSLETWRKARKPGEPIPETLWGQLADLGRRHGVSRVCQALRLDYSVLKRRVQESGVAPDFVEVQMASTPDQPSGCTVQLEDGKGRKLFLRWSCSPGPEFPGVIESFWNQSA